MLRSREPSSGIFPVVVIHGSKPGFFDRVLYTAVRDRVDAQLDRYTRFDAGCPAALGEAIRYSLLAPGKRLRPMLVLLAAEACQGAAEAALPAACAVEMIHTYSLIHDDLPAMDDDDLRRGRPTCHKAFGEATAILAGDALLALAFEVLARDMRPSSAAAEGCVLLAHAAGATQLVGGQADDLLGAHAHAGLEALESIHRRKTGAMFLVSLQLGALVGRRDPPRSAAYWKPTAASWAWRFRSSTTCSTCAVRPSRWARPPARIPREEN